MHDVTTIKILDSTRRRLKVLAARYEVTMIELLDTLVTQEEDKGSRSFTEGSRSFTEGNDTPPVTQEPE